MKGYIFVSVLTILIYQLILCQTANISKKQVNPANQDLNFFLRIKKLNMSWEEILGSYKNVSAEVQTEFCKGKCKTAMALWVLQSLKPCELIEKADCPKGLICCSFGASDEEQGIIPSTLPQDESGNETLFYPEPILDPIPDDESSEFLKV